MDRWHLAKNLGEALERLFARTHDILTAAARDLALQDVTRQAASADAPTIALVMVSHGSRSRRDRTESDNRRGARRERLMAVRNLYAQGLGQMAIAETLGLSHHTVKRYLQAPAFPERKPRTACRSDLLDPFKPYLLQRWGEGCRNAKLFREVQARGYASSRSTVARFVSCLRRSEPATPAPAPAQPRCLVVPRVRPPAPRHLAALYLRRSDDLTEAQRALVTQVGRADTVLVRAHDLGQGFMRLLGERRGTELDAWMAEVRDSAVPELQAFTAGLDTDKAAVVAGLTVPWSTGPVEGTMTRLTLLKRQAYGRAGTAFLRQRLLHAA